MNQEEDYFGYFEKIPTVIKKNALIASIMVAHEIAMLIKVKSQKNQICVLGLATGSTPIDVYKELVRLHKEEGLSFKNVVTFNLDEYYPISQESQHSYWKFMHNLLFDHVDIDKDNIHIPNGMIPRNEIVKYCQSYEALIDQYGIDLQILGIGATGHIGFNEPGSSIKSRTRLISLDPKTKADAASSFHGIENVPSHAITMGVGTILKAKRIIIMAFTEEKAQIVLKVIEGDVNSQYPATYLQQHGNSTFVLMKACAASLTRNQAPWLIPGLRGEIQIEFDAYLAKKAVIWLSQKIKRPILGLTLQDYQDNSLFDLVSQVGQGKSGIVNMTVFYNLNKIITGWPGGGRPDHNPQSYLLHKLSLTPQKVVIFSPHPDDDVICMGGTMKKLNDQGHDLYVAYQVTGSLSVFDSDALRFADFLKEAGQMFGSDQGQFSDLFNKIRSSIDSKQSGDIDQSILSSIKTLIRRTEARQAAMHTGVKKENIFFLDLPFYETGKAEKKPLGPEDIKIVKDFLTLQKPTQIYAAGDLTDPHGTHRVCLNSILAALEELKDEEWVKACKVYLYRGAWQEWELEKVQMAVPLSPEELFEKRQAIFKHQSQKDVAMFTGADKREFWQRAEDRNRQTAKLFTSLGLVNYEAMECFVTLEYLRQENVI